MVDVNVSNNVFLISVVLSPAVLAINYDTK